MQGDTRLSRGDENMNPIKFRYVCYNKHFKETTLEYLTDDMLLEHDQVPCWISSTNCEIKGKQLFTGFKDAAGNDIYDGDLLNEKVPIFDNGQWEVQWNAKVGTWDAYYNKWSTYHSLSHLLEMKQYFIVGSVFDGCAEPPQPGVSCSPK